MRSPKISKQEWPVMEALWRWEELSIREIQTGICGRDGRPAYTTVQTMVYRLEAKGAVRRVGRVRNYDIFAAAITRDRAERQMVLEYLRFFDGRVWPFLEHSIAMGKLKMAEVKAAERYVRDVEK